MSSLSDSQLMDRIISRLNKTTSHSEVHTVRQLSGATSGLMTAAKQLNAVFGRAHIQGSGRIRTAPDSIRKR